MRASLETIRLQGEFFFSLGLVAANMGNKQASFASAASEAFESLWHVLGGDPCKLWWLLASGMKMSGAHRITSLACCIDPQRTQGLRRNGHRYIRALGMLLDVCGCPIRTDLTEPATLGKGRGKSPPFDSVRVSDGGGAMLWQRCTKVCSRESKKSSVGSITITSPTRLQIDESESSTDEQT